MASGEKKPAGKPALEEKKKAQADRLAESIREQERRREEIKFQEEWSKRIEIAREGRIAYERNDPVTAVTNYKKILSLTARRYNVEIENLHPKLFEASTRVNECLLISALTFDLAKIVERLEGEAALRDLKMYLRLFVLFSKDMPFEVVALSTVRKYVEFSHGLKHPKLFENAYKGMRRGSCFVAGAVFGGQATSEVTYLRRFRNTYLRRTLPGRIFINCYAFCGPALAQIVMHFPWLRSGARHGLGWLVARLSRKFPL